MIGSFFSKSSNGTDGQADSKAKISALVDEYWPTIESYLIPFLIKISEDHLKDDAHTASIFEAAHSMLPVPIRLAVRQAIFVQYCQEHRATLITKIDEYKGKRSSLNIETQYSGSSSLVDQSSTVDKPST